MKTFIILIIERVSKEININMKESKRTFQS